MGSACVCVLINKHSFEHFMCLDLIYIYILQIINCSLHQEHHMSLTEFFPFTCVTLHDILFKFQYFLYPHVEEMFQT